MRKCIIMFFVKLRWAYFHVSPSYIKFTMSGSEYHFQNVKTGEIHSNYIWTNKET